METDISEIGNIRTKDETRGTGTNKGQGQMEGYWRCDGNRMDFGMEKV